MSCTDHDQVSPAAEAHEIRGRLAEGPSAGDHWRGHEAYIIVCACGALTGARIEEAPGPAGRAAARRILAE